MKSKITQYATSTAVLAAMLLIAGLFGSVANAQSTFQGKFALPYATQWGKATLQPGDYLLTFNGDGTMLVIRDAKSQRAVAFEPINDREDCREGGSALIISATGEQHVVRSLRISELGNAYVYSRASAREVEEAHRTRTVPVVVAKK
jgi:hypothetical protein